MRRKARNKVRVVVIVIASSAVSAAAAAAAASPGLPLSDPKIYRDGERRARIDSEEEMPACDKRTATFLPLRATLFIAYVRKQRAQRRTVFLLCRETI